MVLAALWDHPAALALIVIPLAVAYALQLTVDARLDRAYSEFWHAIRRPLRKLLGL
jgi:hypothetical protein